MPTTRKLASGLLLFTGIAHLLYYFAGPGAANGPGMAVFGVIYFALGAALRLPAKWPLWLSVVLPAIGGLGGAGLLRASFDPVLALFVAIDVAAVGCCLAALFARRTA